MDPITSAEQWLGHEASLEFGDGDATVLKAEYERLREIEEAIRAWMVTPGRADSPADIGAAHRRLQAALRVPRRV